MSDIYQPQKSTEERVLALENKLIEKELHTLQGQPTGRKFCTIWGNPLIGRDVRIGEYVEIGSLPTFPTAVGDNVSIQAFSYICPGTVIEDGCFVGPRVTILNDKYPPSHGEHWQGVLIKEGASIGGGSTILPGVTIGKQSRVGAGSVVTRSIPDGETWAGNPACPEFKQKVVRQPEPLPSLELDGYKQLTNGRWMKDGKFVKAPN